MMIFTHSRQHILRVILACSTIVFMHCSPSGQQPQPSPTTAGIKNTEGKSSARPLKHISEVQRNAILLPASRGQIPGIKFEIAARKDDIIGVLGRPDSQGFITGWEYLNYGKYTYFADFIPGSPVGMISAGRGMKLFGVTVGMSHREIESILGPPDKRDWEEDIGELISGDCAYYHAGTFMLLFTSRHKGGSTNAAYLMKRAQ